MPVGPHLLFTLTRASYRVRQQLESMLESMELDLTPEEAMTMGLIIRAGANTISELSELLIRDRTTVTRLIESLEHKGYVERVQSPKDRRSVIVRSTLAGAELEHRMGDQVIKVYLQLFKGIKASDLAAFSRTLNAIHRNSSLPLVP